MNKPLVGIVAPVTTMSGYGKHAVDIVKSLLQLDLYEMQIIATRWGDTPQNALDKNNPEHLEILKRIVPGFNRQPDLFIQITVPNEFQPIGKFNIGITAGIETTACSGPWVDGLNKMDLIIVPSKHAKDVFLNTGYNKVNTQTNQPEGVLKCIKAIEVLFEGYDENIYKKTSDIHLSVNIELEKIKENFCYLCVGHWIKGDFGHDRKDIGTLIKCFLETYIGIGNAPALVMKISSANFSILDREQMLKNINSIRNQVEQANPNKKLPNIYLLHGSLDDEEMNSLYNHPKIKAMVTFTKGEGYGRPLAEFSVTGKPILASGWSGQIDFLNPNHTIYLGGKIEKIHQSAVWENVLIPESGWFYVDQEGAKIFLKEVWKNYDKHLERSRGQATYIKNFTLNKMTEKLNQIINQYVPKFAVPIEIILPPLPKLESNIDDGGIETVEAEEVI